MKKEDLEKRIEILEDNINTCIVYLNTLNLDIGIKSIIINILENEKEWKVI